MKKLITICLLVIGMVTQAQTLEHTYSGNIAYTKLSPTEDVFYYYDSKTKSLNIYGTNHSLKKSIPITLKDSTFIQIAFISKTLFNTDNKIKFGLGTYNNNGKYKLQIINEDGQVLFVKDSTFSISFINTLSGLKMILNSIGAKNIFGEVYSIGGTYNLGKKEIDNEAIESLPYPNPTTDLIHLELTKGNLVVTNINGVEVESLAVTGSILYDTTKLVPGIYFYSLNGLNKGRFIKQ